MDNRPWHKLTWSKAPGELLIELSLSTEASPIPLKIYLYYLREFEKKTINTNSSSGFWSFGSVPNNSTSAPSRERTVELLDALPPLLQK